MFNRILVPLDGSALAEQALPVAGRIARACRGSIVLFGAVITPFEYGPSLASKSGYYGRGMEQDELTKVREYLQNTAYSPFLTGIHVETGVAAGAIAPAILTAEHTYQTDLIVISSHSYTGIRHWMLGSVAQKVARYSAVPVLVLHAEPVSLPANQPMRMLIPLDGSPLAEAALEPALQLIAAFSGTAGSSLHLLRVISLASISGVGRGPASIELERAILLQEKQEAYTYLKTLEMCLRLSAPETMRITSSVAFDTDSAAAIVYAAEQDDRVYDVLAMATHGRHGLQRWAMGSITERVLGATHLPLLIVRSPRLQAEQRQPVTVGNEGISPEGERHNERL